MVLFEKFEWAYNNPAPLYYAGVELEKAQASNGENQEWWSMRNIA